MTTVLESIREWLTAEDVSYREVHHEPTRTSEDSARVRGEELKNGGKALVMKLDDTFAEAHFQIGARRVESGRIAEATASFERAVALKPDLPQARFNLVTGLLKLERYSAALGHLEALATKNPGDIQVQRYLEFARAKLREAAKPQR